MKNLISQLNLTDLTNAYGMSESLSCFLGSWLMNECMAAETSPVSFQTTPADPIIKRVETVGKVQPHVKAKIIDTEGNVVDVGKPGEICIAGYLLQKGYVSLDARRMWLLEHSAIFVQVLGRRGAD